MSGSETALTGRRAGSDDPRKWGYTLKVMPLRLCLILACLSLFGQSPKRRIAVFDFENPAGSGAVSSVFFSAATPDSGKTEANLLITRLGQKGLVTVIERAAIDKLMAEQNWGNSDRTDPLTAAKLGRILGVDAIVVGAITQNDYDDKVTGGGGGVGARFGVGGGGMSTKHDIRVKVKINSRVVSTDTAEVLSVSESFGEVFKKGVKVDMRSNPGLVLSGGNAVPDGPIRGEAMEKALGSLMVSLEAALAKIPARAQVFEGLVAAVNEAGRVVLNLGSQTGLVVGDRLQAWRKGNEIRDPASGKLLLRDDMLLGELTVTQVQEDASFASFVGSERPKSGDLVKSVSTAR